MSRCLCAALLLLAASPATAQETIERTPALAGGWVGYDGALFVNLASRFRDSVGQGTAHDATFDLSLGLPRNLLVGARLAPGGGAGGSDDWDVQGRWRALSQGGGAPLDLAFGAAFNGPATSLDGELSIARWLGPLRLLGALRLFDVVGGGAEPRLSAAAGAVLHPLHRRAGVALGADIAHMAGAGAAERLAWSAGVQLGIPYSTHTAAVFATNTRSGTLRGTALPAAGTRWGVEVTAPLPGGRFLGWFRPREEARRAVREAPAAAERVVSAEIVRYLYAPKRLVIEAGTTVEWVNGDAVVHTVSADDGTWDSGAIPPGGSWRATFTEPGVYPYHCGPHPFMKGVVVVR